MRGARVRIKYLDRPFELTWYTHFSWKMRDVIRKRRNVIAEIKDYVGFTYDYANVAIPVLLRALTDASAVVTFIVDVNNHIIVIVRSPRVRMVVYYTPAFIPFAFFIYPADVAPPL